MMKQRLFTLGAFTALVAAAGLAQEPVRAEYFYDSDPGYGQGTVVSGVQAGNNTLQLSTAGLKCGSHLLCMRSQDSRGLWSATLSRSIYVYKVSPTEAVTMEFFLDTDPGYGLGNRLNVAEGENTLALDLGRTACGSHLLCLRAQDNAGNWSEVLSRTLYVCAPRGFVALEYFFDENDPGEGQGTAVAVPSQWDEPFTFDVNLDGLSVGNHQLCVRGKGQDGLWSLVSSEPFRIQEATGINDVTFTMPIDIRAEGAVCTLSGASERGDCRVEVFSLSGAVLASASWPVSSSRLELPVSAARGTVLVVRVTDSSHARALTRRVLMK